MAPCLNLCLGLIELTFLVQELSSLEMANADILGAGSSPSPTFSPKSFTLRYRYMRYSRTAILQTKWFRDSESGQYFCLCGEAVKNKDCAQEHLDSLPQKAFAAGHAQKHWNTDRLNKRTVR